MFLCTHMYGSRTHTQQLWLSITTLQVIFRLLEEERKCSLIAYDLFPIPPFLFFAILFLLAKGPTARIYLPDVCTNVSTHCVSERRRNPIPLIATGMYSETRMMKAKNVIARKRERE